MNGLGVSPDALHRIANGMHASTAQLDAAAQEPVSEVNAGKSTAEVQASIATLLRAAAGLLDGTVRTAEDVSAGRADYTKTDQGAAEELPKVDEGN